VHDLKSIRETPKEFDAGMSRRGISPQSARLLELDAERRKVQTALQEMLKRRNEASREVGEKKKKGEDASAVVAEVQALKEKIAAAEGEERDIGVKLEEILSGLPNIAAPDVPDGEDEYDNEEIRSHGEAVRPAFKAKEHFDLGEGLGLMSFDLAAKMSGARFVVLRGALARLERSLASFMLDLHTVEHGYTEILPPYLVKDNAMYGTGQLPKFADDLFHTEDGFWLIPTAEVPLTNLVADAIVDAADLPIRVTAWTPCFREEAGAAGKDTRGMIRQHQFSKVEMVSVTHPDESDNELERMTNCAEDVLKRLGLSYRVVKLCTGDMGFGARKTYDIEVWLPGQSRYREISSCSNCWDFQARRMGARFKTQGEKGTRHVHTLNGSGVAVGRAMIAVLENYQNEDGSITVPEVLQPYMGGMTRIGL
jgi:seryl-tRNA synthetase